MEFITKETDDLARKKGFDKFFSKLLGVMTFQYELMDWLRGKRGIFIEIETGPTMATQSKLCFSYRIYHNSNGINFETIIISEIIYSDYEECLEEALKESLKLL